MTGRTHYEMAAVGEWTFFDVDVGVVIFRKGSRYDHVVHGRSACSEMEDGDPDWFAGCSEWFHLNEPLAAKVCDLMNRERL